MLNDVARLQMFESTKWVLKESDCTHVDKHDAVASMIVAPPQSANWTGSTCDISEIGIIHQYQFASSLQRMSVITRASGSQDFRAYTKGSPEMIISLSKAETVPNDISLMVEQYTRHGYRVIAIGRRATISETSAEVSINNYLSLACTKMQSEFRGTTSIYVYISLIGVKTVSRNGRAGFGILRAGHSGKST